MTTSAKILHDVLAEMREMSFLDQLKVLYFVLSLRLRRLNERHMKRQIQKSLSRNK
jgi:hypothetical protein